ncbi:Protein CBG00337 [Caenorhabditis briggsae]|uniref:Major sperm protein n=1 Tax=Caenorhabditis briggsae TaxID=6238 RepID=A8WMV1_CAEBR|nr:Protein CBG00337 [Caenorhabditis briggsae]CAP21806.1 Protein CBG00337 [Caenorhabditis briggsae]
MAQSVPPGDIQTQPNAKIVFNAPYDDKHTYHIKVINSSARRIGYGIKTTNMKRLGVDPPCGVLDPKKAVLLAVSCDAFAYGQEVRHQQRSHHCRIDQHTRRCRQAVPPRVVPGRRYGSSQEPSHRVQSISGLAHQCK